MKEDPGGVVKGVERAAVTEAGWLRGLALGATAVTALHLAYADPRLAGMTVVYLWALAALARRATRVQALVLGLTVGLAVMAPPLRFLYGIFSVAAVPLWCILAMWIGLFVVLARAAFRRLPPWVAVALLPFLWTGIEYFRSELYYLRFSWINVGYAFADGLPGTPVPALGMYGAGFLAAALGAALATRPLKVAIPAVLVLSAVPGVLAGDDSSTVKPPSDGLHVAGLQLEGCDPGKFRPRLDALMAQHPDTDLVVLNEYAFSGPVSEDVRSWCRERGVYLVAGGTEPVVAEDQYRNTAFVIGPDGRVHFRQVKCVPIQFFSDGLPAEDQALWESPWGRIGICICYDLSYTRVTDRLVELGAQVLVVPTMDAEHWGEQQHLLHTRVAPTRAREYGIPIVRIASSGISQVVDADGRVLATAPFPGIGESIAAVVEPAAAPSLPPGRWAARLGVALTALWLLAASALALRDVLGSGREKLRRGDSAQPPADPR